MPTPPAQPAYPQVRLYDPGDLSTPIDYACANDLGGDLLLLSACGPLRNGESTGGRWDLSIVPGSINTGTNTCTIRRKIRKANNAAIEESSHPDHDTVITGVKLDGETPYYWGGWQIVFQQRSVGIVDTHTAHFTEGDFLGSVADGNPDAATPGDPFFTKRVACKNNGSDVAKLVTAYCNRPKGMLRRRAGGKGGGVDAIRVTNAAPVPKIVSGQIKPYKGVWTVNGTDPSLRDLTIDGLTVAQLIRVLYGTTVDSTGMHLGEKYRFVSTNLVGTELGVSAANAGGDRFNVILWPPTPTQISADNSGTAAGWDTDDVLIGDLDPSEVGYFWIRVFANIGSGDWNPIQCGAGVDYLKTGAAALDED